MTTLTLVITADPTGIASVKAAAAELKAALSISAPPTGTHNFATLTQQVKVQAAELERMAAASAKATAATSGVSAASARAATATAGVSAAYAHLGKEQAVAIEMNKILGAQTKAAVINDARRALGLKELTASTRTAGAAMHGLERGAAGAAGALWLTYGAMVPLIAAFAAVSTSIKGFKEAANFEYATKFTSTIAEATGDYSLSLDKMRESLLSIKDVVHTPAELATASKELVKAGFDAAVSVGEMATMSRMAAVAEEDLAVITKVVASQYRAWNAEAIGTTRGVSDLNEVANAMTFAAMEAALDIGELGQMLKYTGTLARQTGITFDELLAALGHLSNMGVRGTTAATALRTALLKLQNPTDQTTRKLREFGLSFDFIDKQTGKIKDMGALFTSLQKALANLPTKERVQMIGDLFSLRSMAAGPELIESINKAVVSGQMSVMEFAEAIKKARLEGTFLNKVFSELSETTKFQIDLLKSDFVRELTKAFAGDSLKGLVQDLRTAVNSGMIKTIVEGLAALASGWTMVAKYAREVLEVWLLLKLASWGSAASAAVGGITTLAEAWIGLKLAVEGTLAAFTKNPVGLAALLAYGVYKGAEKLSDRAAAAREEKARDAATQQMLVRSDVSHWADGSPVVMPKPTTLASKPEPSGDEKTAPFVSTRSDQLLPSKTAAERAKRAEQTGAAALALEQQRLQANHAAELGMLQANHAAKLVMEKDFYAAKRALDKAYFADLAGIEAKQLSLKVSTAQAELAAAKAARSRTVFEGDLDSPEDAAKFRERQAAADKDVADKALALELLKRQAVSTTSKFFHEDRNREQALALEDRNRELELSRTHWETTVSEYKENSARRLQDAAFYSQQEGELLKVKFDNFLITEDEFWLKSRELGAEALRAKKANLEELLLSAQAELFRASESSTGKPEDVQAIAAAEAALRGLLHALELLNKEYALHNEITTKTFKSTSDWLGGAEKGLNEYARSVSDVFKSTQQMVTGAFKGMEDALLNFVTTGKMNFADLADSIIKDMMRIMIQQSITGPLASAAAGFIGGLFPNTPADATSAVWVHNGGVIGDPSLPRVSSPPSLFDNAPRFHGGLASDEFPAILQRGEAVIPKGGGVAAQITVNQTVVNNTDATVKTQATPDGNGGVNLEVIIDKLVGKKTGEFGSATNKSLRQGFGARQMLASR